MEDKLYGEIELTPELQELSETPEFQRLKNISQDVLPESVMPWPMASRYEHSLGVAHLAGLPCAENRLSPKATRLLQAAALLHDTGNPALSHLSEPFLMRLNGRDGESFLEEILKGPVIDAAIKRLGLDSDLLVKCVTGKFKPLSALVNGSIDVDNIDNVNRYWRAWHDEALYDGESLAKKFRFCQQWMLTEEAHQEAKAWQRARHDVYGLIYGRPHLNAASMIYRALGLAFDKGEIGESFFRLNDADAIDFLVRCNEESAFLATATLNHVWYEGVVHQTSEPASGLKAFLTARLNRNNLADMVAESLSLPRELVVAYIGKGRDKRQIDLPFIGNDGALSYDGEAVEPYYRVILYLHPEVESKRPEAEEYLRKNDLV